MLELQQNPDGYVFVRTPGGTYIDTLANFALDFGQPFPQMPQGADDRIYSPGVRHAIMGGGNVIAGGSRSWPVGDAILANVQAGLAAKQQRELPPPPSPPPTPDEIYDQAIQSQKLLKGLILALNDGSFPVGQNRTANQIKAAIKAKM